MSRGPSMYDLCRTDSFYDTEGESCVYVCLGLEETVETSGIVL